MKSATAIIWPGYPPVFHCQNQNHESLDNETQSSFVHSLGTISVAEKQKMWADAVRKDDTFKVKFVDDGITHFFSEFLASLLFSDVLSLSSWIW